VARLTRPTDSYEAGQDLDARYFMVDLPLRRRLRLVAGVRWERRTSGRGRRAVRSVDTADRRLGENIDAMRGHLTWSAGPNVNIRGGLHRTVSRPDSANSTPFELTDFVSGLRGTRNRISGGQDRESRPPAEWYPAPRELVALSGFYKDFKDPIEISIAGAPGLQRTPVSGTGISLRCRARDEGRTRADREVARPARFRGQPDPGVIPCGGRRAGRRDIP